MPRSFASPQPNIPGQGILAGYSARFWGCVVAIGVAAGLAGAGFVALLNLVERVAWDRTASQFLAAVSAASPLRDVLCWSRPACSRASRRWSFDGPRDRAAARSPKRCGFMADASS
ncbi:MAG TPA: hypothetical protein VID68_03465 [Solirubrobacteraceae bacterium]